MLKLSQTMQEKAGRTLTTSSIYGNFFSIFHRCADAYKQDLYVCQALSEEIFVVFSA